MGRRLRGTGLHPSAKRLWRRRTVPRCNCVLCASIGYPRMERKGWDVLLCAADDADATALAFAKRAIERRDNLSEAVEERARDWHDWFNGGTITRRLLISASMHPMMSSLRISSYNLRSTPSSNPRIQVNQKAPSRLIWIQSRAGDSVVDVVVIMLMGCHAHWRLGAIPLEGCMLVQWRVHGTRYWRGGNGRTLDSYNFLLESSDFLYYECPPSPLT